MSNPVATERMDLVEFKTSEFLFRENDTSYCFYIITEGSVEIFKKGPSNEEIPLAVIGEGQAVGEFAMILKKPRSASARALSSVKATRISQSAYQKLLDELPTWAIALIETLIQRIENTNEIIQTNKIIDKKLTEEIRSRFGKS